jgi:dUTP pyrophosphatase
MQIRIEYLESYDKRWGELKYAKDGDAGIDIRSTCYDVMMPGDKCIIPCGIRLAIPKGYHVDIRPRSGLAAKYGITIVNSPGTIDSGYRGEIMVILANMGKESFYINPGERIAQMVLIKHEEMELVENVLDETERGSSGFGSSGV